MINFPYFLKSLFIIAASALLFSCSEKKKDVLTKTPVSTNRPNIIYILADDLGYGDIGVYGQKIIETPNIDALAMNGMLFTEHYSAAPVCAPARYMLLSGKHSGHSYIRGNDSWKERGDVWDYKKMQADSSLEGQRPLPEETLLFPKKLQEKGYATAAIGKWGLGAPGSVSTPNKMGFDYFFGYNCQRQAHNYYPLHLYENEIRIPVENDTLIPHQQLPKSFDPGKAASYAAYSSKNYAPDLMYDRMISFIDQHKDYPFFMFWASPLPHVALQAPEKWVNYYKEKIGKEEPYTGNTSFSYFPSQHPRATYAAMVSNLDENIGKLIKHLKDEGLYENTLIIFSSDNGPASNGGADPSFFKSGQIFKTTAGYGKGYVYEGGIRVPMIASWPGKIEPGTKTSLPSTHYDVAATFSDLLNCEMPDNDGISFLPTLFNKNTQQKHDFLYWEFPEYGGQVAVRMGKWKLVKKNLRNNSKITEELYNLENDPSEENNIAEENPEIIEQATKIIAEEHDTPETKSFIIPVLERKVEITK